MKEDYTGSRENRDEIVVTRTATDDPSCSSGYRYDLEVWWDALGFYMTIASYESAGAAMRGYDALWNASQILPEREDPKPQPEMLEREWGWNPTTGEPTPLFIGEFKGLRKETK